MLMAITDFFKRQGESIRRYPRRGELSFTNTAEGCSGPPGTPRGQPSCVLALEKSGPSYGAANLLKENKATNNPALWLARY